MEALPIMTELIEKLRKDYYDEIGEYPRPFMIWDEGLSEYKEYIYNEIKKHKKIRNNNEDF